MDPLELALSSAVDWLHSDNTEIDSNTYWYEWMKLMTSNSQFSGENLLSEEFGVMNIDSFVKLVWFIMKIITMSNSFSKESHKVLNILFKLKYFTFRFEKSKQKDSIYDNSSTPFIRNKYSKLRKTLNIDYDTILKEFRNMKRRKHVLRDANSNVIGGFYFSIFSIEDLKKILINSMGIQFKWSLIDIWWIAIEMINLEYDILSNVLVKEELDFYLKYSIKTNENLEYLKDLEAIFGGYDFGFKLIIQLILSWINSPIKVEKEFEVYAIDLILGLLDYSIYSEYPFIRDLLALVIRYPTLVSYHLIMNLVDIKPEYIWEQFYKLYYYSRWEKDQMALYFQLLCFVLFKIKDNLLNWCIYEKEIKRNDEYWDNIDEVSPETQTILKVPYLLNFMKLALSITPEHHNQNNSNVSPRKGESFERSNIRLLILIVWSITLILFKLNSRIELIVDIKMLVFDLLYHILDLTHNEERNLSLLGSTLRAFFRSVYSIWPQDSIVSLRNSSEDVTTFLLNDLPIHPAFARGEIEDMDFSSSIFTNNNGFNSLSSPSYDPILGTDMKQFNTLLNELTIFDNDDQLDSKDSRSLLDKIFWLQSIVDKKLSGSFSLKNNGSEEIYNEYNRELSLISTRTELLYEKFKSKNDQKLAKLRSSPSFAAEYDNSQFLYIKVRQKLKEIKDLKDTIRNMQSKMEELRGESISQISSNVRALENLKKANKEFEAKNKTLYNINRTLKNRVIILEDSERRTQSLILNMRQQAVVSKDEKSKETPLKEQIGILSGRLESMEREMKLKENEKPVDIKKNGSPTSSRAVKFSDEIISETDRIEEKHTEQTIIELRSKLHSAEQDISNLRKQLSISNNTTRKLQESFDMFKTAEEFKTKAVEKKYQTLLDINAGLEKHLLNLHSDKNYNISKTKEYEKALDSAQHQNLLLSSGINSNTTPTRARSATSYDNSQNSSKKNSPLISSSPQRRSSSIVQPPTSPRKRHISSENMPFASSTTIEEQTRLRVNSDSSNGSRGRSSTISSPNEIRKNFMSVNSDSDPHRRRAVVEALARMQNR